MPRRRSRPTRRGRHLRHEQGLASLLYERAVLVLHRNIECGYGLRGARAAVAQLRDRVVDEDRVADEDRSHEAPVADPEKGDRHFAQLSGARPHEAVRVGEAQHPMRDAPAELAGLRVDVARMQLRIVAGEPGERDEIRIGDRAPRAAERQPHVEVGVAQAGADLRAHRVKLVGEATRKRRIIACMRASRMPAAGTRRCSTTSGPGLPAAASLPTRAPAFSPTAHPRPCRCTSRRRCRRAA
jgi:hypothetical protein